MSPVDRSRLPALGPALSFRFPSVVKHRLANGLRVWTVEHHVVPVMAGVLLVRAGAAADPSGQPGLAAFTGDMLDEGSENLSALDIQDALARIGAELDIEVSADSIALVFTTLARFAGRGMDLVAKVAVWPRLEESDFNRVRELRLNRLLQLRNVPQAVADRAFLEHLYRDHPYGHLAIGTEHGLRAITPADVVAFHRLRLRSFDSTLIVVGDLTHEEMIRVAEEAFGTWSMGVEPGSRFDRDADLERGLHDTGRGILVVNRSGAAQSELRIGEVGAERRTPDYHALLVLNAILGGQFVSRINMKLRQEKGLTYGAKTSFECRLGRGPFSLSASVQTPGTAEAVSDVLAEVRDIRDRRPPTAAEMTLAKASLTGGFPRNFESAEQIARAVTQLALYDLPDDSFEQFVPSVDRVDAETVVRVANRYLDPDRVLAVVVGDHLAVATSLEQLGLGKPILAGC